MILGHLTATAALHREARRRWTRFSLALGPLLLGAYLPDLLDKPLNMIFGFSGHSFGHSLFVQLIVFAPLLLLWRSRRAVLIPVAVGAALHLIEDAEGPKELLAPLMGPIPEGPFYNVLEKFVHFYTTSSPLLWIEIVAALYWIVVAVGLWWSRGRDRRLTAPEGV
jgi:hypothetical protein